MNEKITALMEKPYFSAVLQVFLVLAYFVMYKISIWVGLLYAGIFFVLDLSSWQGAFKSHVNDKKFIYLVITISTTAMAIIFFFANIYEISGQVVYSSDTDLPIKGLWEHVYFSIVTFTTLGYGDLVPLGTARYFAATQALLGLGYFAFLIGISGSIFFKKYLKNGE